MQPLALFFLAATAIGGVAWVFLYPILSGERKAEQRMASVAKRRAGRARAARGTQKSRREQVEDTLKEIDDRRKKEKRVPLTTRIAQAGLTWSKRQFFLICRRASALGLFLIGLVGGAGPLAASALGFAAAFGLPRWLLSFLKKRRESKFLNAFPTPSTSSCAASRPACRCSTA